MSVFMGRALPELYIQKNMPEQVSFILETHAKACFILPLLSLPVVLKTVILYDTGLLI